MNIDTLTQNEKQLLEIINGCDDKEYAIMKAFEIITDVLEKQRKTHFFNAVATFWQPLN